MRRFFLPILPIMALALLGASCEFKAGVNNSIPSREADEPREESGLFVAVRLGDPIAGPSSDPAEGVDAIVAVALSMSALTAEDIAESIDVEPMGMEIHRDWAEPLTASSGGIVLARPAAAIPEPSGLLLFACGLCLSAIVRRRH